ncbi:thiolase family protein [Halalkalibacter alkaliphilus]|uniref:acetyl-CoA C-acetyltransferase n=1 Tax=Halalkalibacter alkaliphilus TaxID=2917993 RepID=A0A9X2CV80_9BACI|nr:thiolase family protein [Halalkalibacter alkaliphilus]MCL7748715.1 thiolase family protein [Halalkalibacter alkaliphilus]
MSMFDKAFIPYGGYYSTPFSKWQGTLQNEHSIELGAKSSKAWFESRNLDPNEELDYLYLGITIGQKRVFYGASWASTLMGAPDIPGQTLMHACATSTTTLYNAAAAIQLGNANTAYCMLVDRCSNGPHTVWPNPKGPGGEVISENWNMDNMAGDPSTGIGMICTAERVAKENGFTKEQADELTFRRYEQYADSLKDDRAFQKKYMMPVEVRISKRKTILLEADEGVNETSKEALNKLKPTTEDGILTFGSQTHPADGNAGIIVTSQENAAILSTDSAIPIQIISYGYARAEKATMPAAPVPAVKMALERAGLSIHHMTTIKNHNPFIVNDMYLAQELGIDPMNINNYGSSLVFGHPQAPTVGRMLIEAIEETVLKGGGYALATGCAAGDNGAAIIVKVG